MGGQGRQKLGPLRFVKAAVLIALEPVAGFKDVGAKH